MQRLSTPVLLLTFNRPEKTRLVFNTVRQVKPKMLLISADGPRKDKVGESEKCSLVRKIFDDIDWECEVLTNYSDVNLGSYKKSSTSLEWAFELVEEAIILEDDCMPDVSFFRFCQELLEHYRDDSNIFLISGNNFQFGHNQRDNSYFFSKYMHTWGWASWRRSWQAIDLEMAQWPEFYSRGGLEEVLKNQTGICYWKKIFQDMYYGRRSPSWDYKLQLAAFMQSGLCITPSVNLVTNIGFEAGSVHHQYSKSVFSRVSCSPIDFPLKHPSYVTADSEADRWLEQFKFSFYRRAYRKLRQLMRI